VNWKRLLIPFYILPVLWAFAVFLAVTAYLLEKQNSDYAILYTLSLASSAAFLAAGIGMWTYSFINRTNQVREWRRDDAHKILKPVYDDLLKIVPIIAKLESPDFSKFKPDFTQAEGSWQEWGLGVSRLTEFAKSVENYEELQGRARDAAYRRFAADLRHVLGTASDPSDEIVNTLYSALYGWAATFGALPAVDPGVAMSFAAKYSAGATRRGNDTSPTEALKILAKVFAAIADEPDVKVFRAVAGETLRSAEKLRDDIRSAIQAASGI